MSRYLQCKVLEALFKSKQNTLLTLIINKNICTFYGHLPVVLLIRFLSLHNNGIVNYQVLKWASCYHFISIDFLIGIWYTGTNSKTQFIVSTYNDTTENGWRKSLTCFAKIRKPWIYMSTKLYKPFCHRSHLIIRLVSHNVISKPQSNLGPENVTSQHRVSMSRF